MNIFDKFVILEWLQEYTKKEKLSHEEIADLILRKFAKLEYKQRVVDYERDQEAAAGYVRHSAADGDW